MRKHERFDPVELAERAIAANLDAAIFQKIDDRHIPRAPNFFEFCVSADFLAMDPGPYSRQIQMGLDFFGEWCPRCSTKGFLQAIGVKTTMIEIRDNVTMLKYGVCPKCGVTQTDLYNSGELKPYEEFIMCAGQRSGKSALTGMFCVYHLHRVLMLPNPAKFYGVMASSTLHMTLIALTAGQIQDNIWDPFIIGLIENSPWFHAYHAFLDEVAKKKGLKPLYSIKETFISYDHKGLILSYSGADFRKLRGKTRIFTCIDELGWFDANAEGAGVKTSGKGQHEALANSLRTVRSAAELLRSQGKNWVPTGIDCNISSPSSALDMIMRLVNSDSPKTCAYHLPTWEINPTMPYASLRHLEMEDKRAFDRDFRAIPPMADSPFMDDEKQVVRSVNPKRQNIITWSTKTEQDKFDPEVETRWLETSTRYIDRSVPRIIAADPGESNNSFALVVCSYNNDTKGVSVDGVIECQPEKRPDGSVSRVNFPMTFDNSFGPLLDRLNIKLVVSDRWQSADLLQRLRSFRSVKAESYSLRYDDMLSIKTAWYDGRIELPATEQSIDDLKTSRKQPEEFTRGQPVLRLLLQALTVREIGRRIEKPLEGSDDIFRAVCLASKYLLDPELNRAFIYSGAGRSVQSDRKAGGALRFNRNPNRVPAQPTMGGVGVRKSRTDSTGIVTPFRRFK